jgi:hypothetical protein
MPEIYTHLEFQTVLIHEHDQPGVIYAELSMVKDGRMVLLRPSRFNITGKSDTTIDDITVAPRDTSLELIGLLNTPHVIPEEGTKIMKYWLNPKLFNINQIDLDKRIRYTNLRKDPEGRGTPNGRS